MDLKILNYLENNFSNFPGEPIPVHPITFKDGKIYFDFPLINKEDTEFCSVPLEELIKDDFVVYEKTSPSIINKCDVLEEFGVYKILDSCVLYEFKSLGDMKVYIGENIVDKSVKIEYSYHKDKI